jgi:hypothetical protein
MGRQWESRETENEPLKRSETKTFRQQKEPMGTNYRWGDAKKEKIIGRDRWHESIAMIADRDSETRR